MKIQSDYEGQVLIATPMLQESIFERSVIYMCTHNDEGAMGLVINKVSDDISFSKLLQHVGIAKGGKIKLPDIPVLQGGPVRPNRGFVLHSQDYYEDEATLFVKKDACLTTSPKILQAILDGRGPKRAILALGYAGWEARQLESEIRANAWLIAPADFDLVFGRNISRKYDYALSLIGIRAAHLSAEMGNA